MLVKCVKCSRLFDAFLCGCHNGVYGHVRHDGRCENQGRFHGGNSTTEDFKGKKLLNPHFCPLQVVEIVEEKESILVQCIHRYTPNFHDF